MKKTAPYFLLIAYLALVMVLSSCAQALVPGKPGNVEESAVEDKILQQGGENGNQAALLLNQLIEPPFFWLPENLIPLSIENVNEISLLGNIYPYEPPIFEITPDGRLSAIGLLAGITIVQTDSGEIISNFEVEFPECGFGFSRFVKFNQDGSFIAIVTKDEIQVWQIGGGLIYTSPHSRVFNDQFPPCGSDIPQVALSPDGRLLAITGIDYSKAEPERFFKVVNIIQNETLYEWDGKDETLHGNLDGFPGLGFSKSGRLLQTFDPRRFILSSVNMHSSFRFWAVDDWAEITDNGIVSEGFDPGDLLFPLANEGMISIVDKPSGGKVGEVAAPGCDWDKPCEMVFSNDGTKALLLSSVEPISQYRQSAFYPEIEIWDLENESKIKTLPGMFRNLHGLRVTDEGWLAGFVSDNTAAKEGVLWWTFPEFFQGFSANAGSVSSFVPTWADTGRENECRFCDTCRLVLDKGKVECRTGIENFEGVYSIEIFNGEYWLVKHYPDDVGQVGKLSRQIEGDQADQRYRLLGFSEEYQTAFYCLDSSYRQQSCVIDELRGTRVLGELNDISFLQVSPDGRSMAFIDKSSSSLYLYRFDTQKLSRKSHFQAKAAKTNPLFSEDGKLIFYLVENLRNSKDFSVEIMDAENQKVIKRIALKSDIVLPAAFSMTTDQNIWAVGEKSGRILLFSAEDGRLLSTLDSDQEAILGLYFDSDRLLISLNSTGMFNVWGIEK